MNVVEERPDRLEEMSELLATLLELHHVEPTGDQSQPLPEEEREALRALGYLD